MRGKFITIYGINNIGKTTHCKLLLERLIANGNKAKYVKYPIYDLEPTGPFLNRTLRNSGGQKISEDELQLWFILNRYQFQPTLMQWLDEGYIVVAEDYIGTGIAWGTAKGLERQWLTQANKHLLKEDFAILLEGERDLRAKEKNHLHEENEELIEKCRQEFEILAEKNSWMRLNLKEKIEDSAEIIWQAVVARLK